MDPLVQGTIQKMVGAAVGAVALLAGMSTTFVFGSLYAWWEDAHRRRSLFEEPYSARHWQMYVTTSVVAFIVAHIAFRLLRRWMLTPRWRGIFTRDFARVLMWSCYLVGAAPALLLFIAHRRS